MSRNDSYSMPEAATVRNRDIPKLARVLSTMRDVTNIEQMRDWQRARMYSITQHLSGMPGGGGTPKGLDDTFARLSEMDDEHKEKCRRYMRELEEAEGILNRIESPAMRTFVVMKYVLDIPNVQIARELNLTEWKFNQMRRCVEQAADMEHVVWKEPYKLVEN